MYGKKIKNLAYNTNKYKLAFNSRFFNLLVFLETRLNIVLLRLAFFFKLLQANKAIIEKKVFVNKKSKNSNYILKNGDILNISVLIFTNLSRKRFRNLT
jgi:ribosomal protein S4